MSLGDTCFRSKVRVRSDGTAALRARPQCHSVARVVIQWSVTRVVAAAAVIIPHSEVPVVVGTARSSATPRGATIARVVNAVWILEIIRL